MKQSILIGIILITAIAQGQTQHVPADHCGSDEAMEIFYSENPDQRIADQKISEQNLKIIETKSASNCYVIPVVFHVYGNPQGGYPVNLTIIQGALDGVNDDFQALNADWNDVHNDFLSVRGAMPDVYFILAQLDPNGNTTNGIMNHPVTAGYGNTNMDAQIAADAWDNYSYMNVYVMNDIYNDGVLNNSGISWYPNSTMSNNNTARVVYNGRYLGVNCDFEPEFASVLTHEFGHWLDLRHTFQGGCTMPNDLVGDTPACNYLSDYYTCHTSNTVNSPLNCSSELINVENYMDYSGADGCNKMFTLGQNTRMYAGLLHPSRVTLHQDANLLATGILDPCDVSAGIQDEEIGGHLVAFPNPTASVLFIELPFDAPAVELFDLQGRSIQIEIEQFGDLRKANIDELTPGIYLLRSGNSIARIIVE